MLRKLPVLGLLFALMVTLSGCKFEELLFNTVPEHHMGYLSVPKEIEGLWERLENGKVVAHLRINRTSEESFVVSYHRGSTLLFAQGFGKVESDRPNEYWVALNILTSTEYFSKKGLYGLIEFTRNELTFTPADPQKMKDERGVFDMLYWQKRSALTSDTKMHFRKTNKEFLQENFGTTIYLENRCRPEKYKTTSRASVLYKPLRGDRKATPVYALPGWEAVRVGVVTDQQSYYLFAEKPESYNSVQEYSPNRNAYGRTGEKLSWKAPYKNGSFQKTYHKFKLPSPRPMVWVHELDCYSYR